MNKILSTVAVATLALSAASCTKCKKDDIPTTLHGYFYTPDSLSSEKPLALYMDGVKKGYLPYIRAAYDRPLDFADPILKSTALQFEFMSGTHIFESRDIDGKVVSSSTMSFDYYNGGSSGSATSNVGGAGSSTAGNTAVVWLTR